MKRFAVAGIFMLNLSAHAIEPIMGLPFGKLLDRRIEACVYNKPIDDEYCSDTQPIEAATTVKRATIRRPDYGHTRTLPIPAWVKIQSPIDVKFSEDGAIAMIQASTLGLSHQATVVASITERFGQPTKLIERAAQSVNGAQWKVLQARWETTEVNVVHDCASVSFCMVVFVEPKFEAIEVQRRAEEQKARNKL